MTDHEFVLATSMTMSGGGGGTSEFNRTPAIWTLFGCSVVCLVCGLVLYYYGLEPVGTEVACLLWDPVVTVLPNGWFVGVTVLVNESNILLFYLFTSLPTNDAQFAYDYVTQLSNSNNTFQFNQIDFSTSSSIPPQALVHTCLIGPPFIEAIENNNTSFFTEYNADSFSSYRAWNSLWVKPDEPTDPLVMIAGAITLFILACLSALSACTCLFSKLKKHYKKKWKREFAKTSKKIQNHQSCFFCVTKNNWLKPLVQ